MLDPEHDIDKRPFSMDTPPVLQAIADTQRVLGQIGARPEDSGNEVAVVVDWRERLRCSNVETFTHALVYTHSLPGLYASGVPFDFMSLDDFLAQPAGRYRKAVFLNVFAPEGELRTALQQRVSASDFKSVWLFHCPFSLPSSQATVRDINNMPYHVTNPTVWPELTLQSDGPNTWVFKAVSSASESWQVGDSVVATLGADGVLTLTGPGSMYDFAAASDAPWDPAAVSAIAIGDGVVPGANAFASLPDAVPVRLSLGELRSGFASAVPDGMALVSTTELEAPGIATLAIEGGTAVLGIAVCTNADLNAKAADWAPVSLEKADLGVSADGTRILVPVPVNAERGFMLLRSGAPE